jgi:cytochrome c oxidase subunit II
VTDRLQNSRVFSGISVLLGSLLCENRLLAQPNTSIFSPVSTPANSIYSLGLFVLAITAGIFAVVATLLVVAVVRFRARHDDHEDELEPAQVFGSTQIELSWTIVPCLIIVVLFLTTARIIFAIQDAPKPASALEVTVIGHQFWWEYRYPKYGIVTANELHIPVSNKTSPTPTFLKLGSADVIHSFWVPNLAGKVDVIPNQVNDLWMDPEEVGLYKGQCTQFCGAEHALMLLRVYVDTPEQFQAWIKAQQRPAVDDPSVAEGRHVFETQSCINCHRVTGTIANGRFGPDLTHLMSRQTLASGAVANTPENLKKWIADPSVFKAGCLMPAMQLTDHQVDQITAYLTTLK